MNLVVALLLCASALYRLIASFGGHIVEVRCKDKVITGLMLSNSTGAVDVECSKMLPFVTVSPDGFELFVQSCFVFVFTVCLFARAHTHTCVHACMRTCMHAHMHACVHMNAHARTRTRTHTRTPTHAQARARTLFTLHAYYARRAESSLRMRIPRHLCACTPTPSTRMRIPHIYGILILSPSRAPLLLSLSRTHSNHSLTHLPTTSGHQRCGGARLQARRQHS